MTALPGAPAVDPLSGAGLVITFNQLLIGLALGFSLRLVFSAVEMAGQIIGQLMSGYGCLGTVDAFNAGKILEQNLLAGNGYGIQHIIIIEQSFNLVLFADK